MVNYCTNCGCEIRKDDNFCTNCGAKIRKDHNFCFNCGTEIKKDYKFCTNCGAKIDNSNVNQDSSSSEPLLDRVNKILMEQKREEQKKKLKTVDEIFESEEIKSEIRKNNADKIDVILIKEELKNKIVNKQENMTHNDIKNFIKKELEEIGIPDEKPIISKKEKENKPTSGGYCSFGCMHCYEEFFDGGGAIVGDFDGDGYVEYYCRLGHNLAFGRYCEDFK
ncbi:zinc-ribbon domain-containing protein [Methanobrevibacter sp.]|uniref:zinc ribbon domain-containing protein n=1 Tax=Methanobrevibacter sp. TaxID=66852 RepID=UPI00388E1699